MASFILSGFSDEASPVFDEQIKYLSSRGFDRMEIRGVDGTPIGEISASEAKELRKKLDGAGLGVSAVGSGVGKIKITEDFLPHFEQAKRVYELANILGTPRVRAFSFYIPDGDDPSEHRSRVIERLGILSEEAERNGITLCLENEKAVYGESVEGALDILKTFPAIRCVFDSANFISSGIEPYPYAFGLLKPYIEYIHVKDANENAEMVPAGEGKGGYPEILSEMSKEGRDIILTLEPHLMEFEGLAGLEQGGHRSKLQNRYANRIEAFDAAKAALDRIIEIL